MLGVQKSMMEVEGSQERSGEAERIGNIRRRKTG